MNVRFKCPNCGHSPLVRVHKKNGVYCNHCNEPLLKQATAWSTEKYIKCPNPKCGYEGPELINPRPNTRCPKCNTLVLRYE